MEREEGFYWVRKIGECGWEIARWSTFLSPGIWHDTDGNIMRGPGFAEIDEREIERETESRCPMAVELLDREGTGTADCERRPTCQVDELAQVAHAFMGRLMMLESRVRTLEERLLETGVVVEVGPIVSGMVEDQKRRESQG